MPDINPEYRIMGITQRYRLLLVTLTWAVFTPTWAGTLQGTAFYRERIALPPNAVFEAQLLDVSRADAPAMSLGRATIDPTGSPPFNFEIRYDDAALQSGHRYTVRATVAHQGTLLFTTDTNYPVITDRSEPLNMRLISVGDKKPSHNDSAEPDLRGTYWKLVRLGDMPVQTVEQQAEPHLIFAVDQLRLSGNSGCNRIMGGFELNGDKLHFSQMAGTMMACMNSMELEQQFLQTLTEVERYRIQDNHLEMFDASGKRIAEFEAGLLP